MFGDYSMLETLYKIHFRLLGNENSFHAKAKNERCTAASFHCHQNLKNGELKQGQRRRQQECHLKMYPHVSVVISQLFKVIMLPKCALGIKLEPELQR